MSVKIITPPASEPVTLQEAALHCRVDSNAGPVVACATVINTATVTPASVYGIVAGMGVTGAGIPSSTTVLSVGTTTITLSKNATATATAASLTFVSPDASAGEDSLLSALIVAAREYCEAYQNRAYVTQTIELSLDRWPRFPVNLPRPPLVSVASIKYYDTANMEHTFAATSYFVDADSEPGRIALAHGVTLPTITLREIGAVKIQYTAGAAVADVPQRVKQAILLLIGYWYENREAALSGKTSAQIEFSVRALLGFDRVVPT